MAKRGKVDRNSWKPWALCAAALAAFLGMLLPQKSGAGGMQEAVALRTYVQDGSGIANGTMVRLNKLFTVGYVERSWFDWPWKKDVQLTLKVYGNWMKYIPADSVVEVSAANLHGARHVNISQGFSRRTVTHGAVLRFVAPRPVIPFRPGELWSLLGNRSALLVMRQQD